MKNGDISNVTSPQAICVSDVVLSLYAEEEKGFLRRKTNVVLGDIDRLAANKLWILSNNYSISLEMAAFESEGWTPELLDKAMERLERRVVNPFNYWELYSDVEELVGTIPYRPNLKAVIDIPSRVARYGSAGVELDNL